MDIWDAHAAAKRADSPPKALEPPRRMEWTQRPGIGPGAEVLGGDLGGCRIVELGCGAGRNSAHLAAAGAIVTGVDRSAGQIRRARAHYAHTGARFVREGATLHLARSAARLDARSARCWACRPSSTSTCRGCRSPPATPTATCGSATTSMPGSAPHRPYGSTTTSPPWTTDGPPTAPRPGTRPC